jgi:AraC family transcriptional regulator, alkane utilization regulator
MDVLSDTLQVVRLAGALFFTAKVSGPWSLQSPASDEYARLLNSQADCITIFHIVASGRCWVTVDGQSSFQLAAGDVVIFPHAEAHCMSSHADALPEIDVTQQVLSFIRSAPPDQGIPQLTFGKGSETVHFVCGYLQCDQLFNPLIGSLPAVLLVCANQPSVLPTAELALPLAPWCVVRAAAGDWLGTTLRYTIEEADGERPGSSAMLPRLTELLFVDVLRRYMQQLPAEYTGWLAAVRDPVVGSALRMMHSFPDRPWTVEELAYAAAVSRSALAQRFNTLIGEPPMQYLQGWRMQLAKNMLGQTNLSMPQIAQRIGYESVAAFSRAFKRSVGQPPATWRQGRLAQAADR